MSGLRVAMLAPNARTFIEGLALALAPRVGQLGLWVRHNRVVDVAAGLPWARAKAVARRYGAAAVLGSADWPANVNVRLASVTYLRRDGSNPGLGRRLGRAWLGQLAKGAAPDVLHGQFLHPQGVAAAHAARRLGRPLVLTGHGFDVYDLPRRAPRWEALLRDTLAQADAVITVSQRNALLLRGLGVAASRLTVIPNGYDPRRFKPMPRADCRAQLGLPPGKTLIACIGNLEPVKGQDLLLAAFRAVRGERRDSHLALVGGGSMEATLLRQVARAGLQDAVTFAGPRAHEEVPVWLNAADLLVLPSRDEGNPTIVAEAVGCGTPVVATRVGGVPDVLPDAPLVEPGDADALARAILRALDTRHAPPRAAADLRWDSVAERTAAVYRAVAS